jgi:peptidyl-prolyl cis-trans isomerase B (cyclophilin B)
MPTRAILVGLGILVAVPAGKAQPPVDVTAQLQRILALEHTRPSDAQVLGYLSGIEAFPPDLQRMAVRALGRLERPTLVPRIARFIMSANPVIRLAAAHALAQTFERASPDDVRRHSLSAFQLLTRALRAERDDYVRAGMALSLGRLPYRTAGDVRAAESAILDVLEPADRKPAPETITQAAIGMELLIRRTRGLQPPSEGTIRALRALVMWHTTAAGPRPAAMSALIAGAALDDEVLDTALNDPAADVRRLAASALRTRGVPLSNERRSALIDRALGDLSGPVRLEGLRAYATFPVLGCSPIVNMLGDQHDHVVLLALDLLAAPCAGELNIVEILAGYVNNLPDLREWHRAVHALVALARRDPERAAKALPEFTNHSAWEVRVYAVRAAMLLKDIDRLTAFASDPSDNVVQASITALRDLVGHEADHLYRAALSRDDDLLVISAAAALEGTAEREQAAAAVLHALTRITSHKRETSRLARLALLARLREVGVPAHASSLQPYLSDFDPYVCTEASNMIQAWTGATARMTPQPLPPVLLPTAEELRYVNRIVARVMMKWAGTFEIEFLVDEAPLTAVRFVRLAQSKYYEGLSVHRVVPNFGVQAGSPGGNDYAGPDRYFNDELGRVNMAGVVALPNLGRDMGNGQLFISVVDNPALGHELSPFAVVTRGIDPGTILEGDTIERIVFVPAGRQ